GAFGAGASLLGFSRPHRLQLRRGILRNKGQILPFASILKNYKSYKSTQWEQRARSAPYNTVGMHDKACFWLSLPNGHS
ncbi:TPA: hypothetical protein ACT9K3_003032, partial [Legionella pneumophila]